MDGLSLHYYTLPEVEDDWNKKGSATDFTEEIFYQTLKRGYFMDELINRHGAIMDEYDPDKKIGLIVDEWGIWTDVEPGTNPGFLYQQNTMRDALVAGMTLNIFNKHSDRVKMACIAQLINVLQSVMLTDGEKMIKTPTYHVFHMYRHHQGATLLRSDLIGAGTVGAGKNELPKVIESVSENADGVITVTLTNNSLEAAENVTIQLTDDGAAYGVCEASVVAGTMNAHNTFEAPEVVTEQAFAEIKNYSWVVLTSSNGVQFFLDELKERRMDIRSLAGLKFAVIGAGTKAALEAAGIYADFVPGRYSSRDLAAEWIPGLTAADKVLLLRAESLHNLLVFNDDWGTYRGVAWRAAFGTWADGSLLRKIVGIGPGMMHTAVAAWAGDAMTARMATFYAAHNEYLEQLLTTGILGLAAWLLLVAAHLRRGERSWNTPGVAPVMLALCSYLAQAVVSIRVSMVFPLVMLLFGALAALTAPELPQPAAPAPRGKKQQKPEPLPSKNAWYFAKTVLAAVLCMAAASGIAPLLFGFLMG